MNTRTHKTQENKNRPATVETFQMQDGSDSTFQFTDNRPWVDARQKLQMMANGSKEAARIKMYQQIASHSPQVTQLQAVAETILSSHSIPPVKQRTHLVLQRNAVRDAFSAGARVVVAGEKHDRLQREEEKIVWEQDGVSVNAEYDALTVDDNGTSKEIKLDDPYLRLLYQVDGIGEIFQGKIYEWARETNKDDQAKLLQLLRDECSEAKADWNVYLENPGDKAQQKHVRLLIEYTKSIEQDMVSYSKLPPLHQQTRGNQYLQQASMNVDEMRKEVRKGYSTQPESNVTNNLAEARSKRMFKNLRLWGANSAGATIWKVGDSHITDMRKMLSNGSKLPDEVALLSQKEYEKAFLELSRVKRAKVSEEFSDTIE